MSDQLFSRGDSEPLPDVGPDSPHTLYQLSQLTHDPLEAGKKALDELDARLDQHSLLVGDLFNEQTDLSELPERGALFQLDAQGAPQTLSEGLMEQYGLPESPDGIEPVAVAVIGGESSLACMLGIDGDGYLGWRKLLDQSVRTSSDSLDPKWVSPGDQAGDDASDFIDLEQGESFVRLAAKSTNGDVPIRLIRNEANQQEKAAMNEKDYARRTKWSKRVGSAALVVSGLFGGLSASAGSEITYDAEIPQYTDIESIDDSAFARFEAARTAVNSDNLNELESLLVGSDFAPGQVSEQAFEGLEEADSIEQIIEIAQDELEQFDVKISVPEQSTTQFVALESTDIEAVRNGVFGVLSFADQFGALMNKMTVEGEEQALIDQDLVIELVDGVLSNNEDNNQEFADGHYDNPDPARAEPETIRISVGRITDRQFDDPPENTDHTPTLDARNRIENVFAHEEGHSLDERGHIGISTVWQLNPENTRYESQSFMDESQVRKLIPGQEVVTAYGGTQPGEDLAEVVEALNEANFTSLADIETPLGHKFAAVMSDLEEEHPGISAAFFMNLRNQPSDSARVELVQNLFSSAQENGGKIALPALLVALASASTYAAAAYHESRKR